MKCVILAAGEGMRMRPLTLENPKPMLKISGRPILEHIFGLLPEKVDELILVVGYLEDKIKSHFGDGTHFQTLPGRDIGRFPGSSSPSTGSGSRAEPRESKDEGVPAVAHQVRGDERDSGNRPYPSGLRILSRFASLFLGAVAAATNLLVASRIPRKSHATRFGRGLEMGSSFGRFKISYVTQSEKLGTYHALKLCEPLLDDGEKFLFLFADDLHGKEGLKMCADSAGMCLLVSEAEDPKKFGVVEIGSDGSIKSFEEKPENPKSNLVSTGVMLLDKEVFKYPARLAPSGEYYLTDSLAQMLLAGRKIYAIKSNFWLPIGYPEDLKKAEEKLKLF